MISATGINPRFRKEFTHFWHWDEFFTYMAILLFSTSTSFVEKTMTVALFFLSSKNKGSISKQSSYTLRSFSSNDFNVIILSYLTCLCGSGRTDRHILGTQRCNFFHHHDEIKSEHLQVNSILSNILNKIYLLCDGVWDSNET